MEHAADAGYHAAHDDLEDERLAVEISGHVAVTTPQQHNHADERAAAPAGLHAAAAASAASQAESDDEASTLHPVWRPASTWDGPLTVHDRARVRWSSLSPSLRIDLLNFSDGLVQSAAQALHSELDLALHPADMQLSDEEAVDFLELLHEMDPHQPQSVAEREEEQWRSGDPLVQVMAYRTRIPRDEHEHALQDEELQSLRHAAPATAPPPAAAVPLPAAPIALPASGADAAGAAAAASTAVPSTAVAPPPAAAAASTSASPSASPSVDLLCVVCTEVFLDPRTLGCGHTVCTPCLTGIDSAGMGRRCPSCRKGYAEWPAVNIALRDLARPFLPAETDAAAIGSDRQQRVVQAVLAPPTLLHRVVDLLSREFVQPRGPVVAEMAQERERTMRQILLLTPGHTAIHLVKMGQDLAYDTSSAAWAFSGWLPTVLLGRGLIFPLLVFLIVGGLQMSGGGVAFTSPACAAVHEANTPSLLRVSELFDPYRLSNGTHTLMDGQSQPFEHARSAAVYTLSGHPQSQTRPAAQSQLMFLQTMQAESRKLETTRGSGRKLHTPALDWARMRHAVLPPDLWNPADTAGWILIHERNVAGGRHLPAHAETLVEMLTEQLTEARLTSRCFAPTRATVSVTQSGGWSGARSAFIVSDSPAPNGWMWTLLWTWNPLRFVLWLLRTLAGWAGAAWLWLLWKLGDEDTVRAVDAAAKAAAAALPPADSLAAYWSSLLARMESDFTASARQLDSGLGRVAWISWSSVLNALILPSETQAAEAIAGVIEYPAALASRMGEVVSPLVPSLVSIGLSPLFVRWLPAAWYLANGILSLCFPCGPWTVRVLLCGAGWVGLLQFLRAIDSLNRFLALGIRATVKHCMEVHALTGQWTLKRLPAQWRSPSVILAPRNLCAALWSLLIWLGSALWQVCVNVALTHFSLAYCFMFSWQTQLYLSCTMVVLSWVASLGWRIGVPAWALVREQEQQAQQLRRQQEEQQREELERQWWRERERRELETGLVIDREFMRLVQEGRLR